MEAVLEQIKHFQHGRTIGKDNRVRHGLTRTFLGLII